MALLFKHFTQVPFTHEYFVSTLVEICQMVLERTIFKFCQYIFRYFVINKNPWKFIWTKLNSFHIRILCAKFGWNRPSGSGEEKKTKIWKVYNNSDKNDNDDDGQVLFRKAHIGFDELKSEIGIVSI